MTSRLPVLRTSKKLTQGFTLIELLVVIAIIAIIASILFPVFATAREKGRQAVCQNNLKQFMMAILMYTNDDNEKMPLAVSGSSQIGPATAKANGLAEFGIHTEIMPYIKSAQVFECPDDNGFQSGTSPQCGGVACAGDTIAQAYGTSYRFTPENFSQLPSTFPVPSNPHQYEQVDGDGLIGPPGGPYDRNPPFPMPMAFFQRPAETRVMRCYVAYFDTDDDRGNVNTFHPDGDMVSFMDGHVKWVKNLAQFDSYCDGPTWSPVRNDDQPNHNANGDGSCGAERKEQ